MFVRLFVEQRWDALWLDLLPALQLVLIRFQQFSFPSHRIVDVD
jgi:hypothetical protein